MIEVFLHGTFGKAKIVSDLLVGLGFGDESHNLLFAEGEGLTWSVDSPALGRAACGTSVLFSAAVKTGPATSTTPGRRPAYATRRNIQLVHNHLVRSLDEILMLC